MKDIEIKMSSCFSADFGVEVEVTVVHYKYMFDCGERERERGLELIVFNVLAVLFNVSLWSSLGDSGLLLGCQKNVPS